MIARPLALVRTVPDGFAAALVGDRRGTGLDVAAARRQHARYREALEAGGFSVEVIPGDEAHPDSPFIEDTAVVVNRWALATRPGHPSRRGEVGPVAEALARHVDVAWAPDDVRIDGGDVLQVGGRIFVGRSARTDDAGIAALARFAAPLGRTVVPVRISGVLHLKSAATALGDDLVLLSVGAVDPEPFEGLEIEEVPGPDAEAANVVRLPDGSVLVAAHHENTAAIVARRGLRPVLLDTSEFAAADGGLTCLSIRLRSVLAPVAT